MFSSIHVFNFSHSGRFVVIPNCCFNLHFLINNYVEHSSCAHQPCLSLVCEVFVQAFIQFLFGSFVFLFWVVRALHVFWIQFLCQTLFYKYFLPAWDLRFHFLNGIFFACSAEVFHFSGEQFINILFYDYCFFYSFYKVFTYINVMKIFSCFILEVCSFSF